MDYRGFARKDCYDWKMEAGIRCSYQVISFPRFRRELARTQHNLTPDTAVVFLLPEWVIYRGFPSEIGDVSAVSYPELVEPASGIIELGDEP
jgi:hypothetical protein